MSKADRVVGMFKEYYEGAELKVPDIDEREFGWLTWDGAMVRHKSFKTATELKSFLVKEVPLGVYYSTALYEDPENRDMEAKGWRGADLVFDIDGDHLDTPNCRGVELITFGCLEDAKEEVAKLLDVLREELGLKAEVMFSGHRGFHAHVRDEGVRGLTAAERRRLVDFILARNLDLSKFAELGIKAGKRAAAKRGAGRRSRAVRTDKAFTIGSLARVARAARGLDPAVHIDEVVTADVHRLIRMPGSLHNKTGLIASPVDDLSAPIERIIERAIAFKGTAKVVLKAPVEEVLGEKIGGRPGDRVVVPAHIAVYLHLQGLAIFSSL